MAALLGQVPIFVGVPIAMLGLLSTVSPAAANTLQKIFQFWRAMAHLMLSNESPGKSTIKQLPDPDQLINHKTEKVNIIFVRHCESTWNEVFNRGNLVERLLMMPFRVARALFNEALQTPMGGSIFLDSPISVEGTAQARMLLAIVEGKEAVEKKSDDAEKSLKILRGTEGKSILVSSNLQRCLETIVIGFWGRLQRSGERVYVLSDLQETSANVDTMTLSKPKGLPPLLSLGAALEDEKFEPEKRFEASQNMGQKQIFEPGVTRIARFAGWCFDAKEASGSTIIVSGHSLYFKTFFQMYLGRSVDHVCKKKKIVNAGAVAFTLERGTVDGKLLYRIDPSSISVVVGGFSK
eukprot:CAMPEP_0173414456 /NCGR_PEP_ID=MMETSP1356-20130122/84337_1 /TAXON_ID=77927 ORGANISM="Hemiselmis virescens, Strain PCC157" /NCGR_SAMPLE_ID=MMETSP1356 /ASSEMBLY_ACC=CAM_ASM_000847 /LENGTH=350 /DNA_ID=CAMNT_0014376639 /DNA_START=34 /DNA_END=1086 /DNA_ORIENTATION=-